MRNIDFSFAAILILLFILAGFVGAAQIEAVQSQDPTPYITATAPMPGDPPPSQDWLDGRATIEAAFQQTKEARFHSEPYPAPFETPTPSAYPDQGNQTTDEFSPSSAGLWSFIWDLLTGK